MNCAFVESHKRVKAGEGYTQRKDVHLDRMAAYLVAMNGDPNKPEAELTAYPRLLPPPCARANLQPCSPHLV